MSESIDFQTWICPKCCDDHFMHAPCSQKDDSPFMPSESDHSHIANEFRKLKQDYQSALDEIEKLRGVLEDCAAYNDTDFANGIAGEIAELELKESKERFKLS